MQYLVSALVFLFITSSSHSQPRERFELLSESIVTGAYFDLKIEGDHMYAASGYGIEIFDISSPNNLQFLQRISTAGNAVKLAVHQNVIYVCDNFRGIHAFDVSNLDNVRRTWTLHEFEGQVPDCRDVTVHENRLYACVWAVGVMIFDISTPTRPELLGIFDDSPYPGGIDFQDTLAFIIDNAWESFIVADLRNPEDLFAYNGAGRRIPGNLKDVTVYNNMLFLAQSEVGVTIYDIGRPLEPERLQVLELEGVTRCIIAEGNYAYASCGSGGLQTIDIHNPEEAELVDVDDETFSSVSNFIIGGNSLAYCAGEDDGLAVYDLSDPDAPEPGALLMTPPLVHSAVVFRETAYVAYGRAGVMIMDVSDPSHPEVISEIDSINALGVYVNDDWLYLTTYNPQNENYFIQSWYLSDPREPEGVWHHRLDEKLLGIKVWDELLYLHLNPELIEIWEISDPDHPSFVAEVEVNDFQTFDVRGDLLFGIDSETRLRIISVRDPDDPQWLGSSGRMYAGNSITVRGSSAFIADGNGGVRIYDVSNPIRIVELDRFQTRYRAEKIYINNDKLWVCNSFGGVQVFLNNLDDGYPELGYIDTYGRAESAVILDDDVALVADYYSLAICRYDIALDVKDIPDKSPSEFELFSAYPNPFNSSLRLDFRVTNRSEVALAIYNLQGREVQRWDWDDLEVGNHSVQWDAGGGGVYGIGSGIYFCRLSYGGFSDVRKVLLIR